MSLSPSCGQPCPWPQPKDVLQAKLWVGRPEALQKEFARGTVVTSRGPAGFHVALPALDCGYFVTCGGYVVVYVPPRCTGSAEVMYNKVQARRCRFRIYTTLGTTGNAQPSWATGPYATQWWDTPTRRLAQPLQDAILATGSQSTCVYAVRVIIPRSSVWIAIWRIDGGLYSYDHLQTLHSSGKKVMAALVHELSQSCPEARLDGRPSFFGLEANPEARFPDTMVAPANAVGNNPGRLLMPPLCKLPKFVSPQRVYLCANNLNSVPRVFFRPNLATILVKLPAELATTAPWTFSLGVSPNDRTERREAQLTQGRLECTVYIRTWARLAGSGGLPWLYLFLTGPDLTAEIAVPRRMLCDVASGRGFGSDETATLKTCALLTRSEFAGLDKAVATKTVVAAVVEDSVDGGCVEEPHPKRVRTDGGDSRSRKSEIRDGVAQILNETTGADALKRFASIQCPTWRHVDATLRRVLTPPVGGAAWSAFLGACARRLKKLPGPSVRKLVHLLRHADVGDNGELAKVVVALKECGFAADAAALGQRLDRGTLRYLCTANELPAALKKRCFAEGRVLESGSVGIWLRLIVTEPSVFKLCPEWKTGVTMPMYKRSSGAEIYAAASTAAAKAVDAAAPWRRKKVALDGGVLAYVSNTVDRASFDKVRFTDALKLDSV